MRGMKLYANSRYFFLGSLNVLVGVAFFFLTSIGSVQRSPGVEDGAVNSAPLITFIVFFVAGLALLGFGVFDKISVKN